MKSSIVCFIFVIINICSIVDGPGVEHVISNKSTVASVTAQITDKTAQPSSGLSTGPSSKSKTSLKQDSKGSKTGLKSERTQED